MKQEERSALVVTVCALGLIGLMWVDRRTPARGMSDATSELSDSISITGPTHDSAIARLDRVDTRLTAVDQQLASADQRLARAAAASQARADRERARADSLAAVAQLASGDVEAWKNAYNARLEEANERQRTVDTLQRRVGILSSRVDSLKVARDSMELQRDLERDRRMAHERLNEKLKTDLRKAVECKIVGPIRCLTRKETVVATIVIDRAITIASKR